MNNFKIRLLCLLSQKSFRKEVVTISIESLKFKADYKLQEKFKVTFNVLSFCLGHRNRSNKV